MRSKRRALDQTRDGMKIDQLNDSERSPNISLFFQFPHGWVMDMHNIYQYTKTFSLINTTIKNIAINMGIIWRRYTVLGQSEVVCTVAILEVQSDTPFSLCRERSRVQTERAWSRGERSRS